MVRDKRKGHGMVEHIESVIFNDAYSSDIVVMGDPIPIKANDQQLKLLNSNFAYISSNYRVERPKEVDRVKEELIDKLWLTSKDIDRLIVTNSANFKQKLHMCVEIDTIFLIGNLSVEQRNDIDDWVKYHHPAATITKL